MVYIQTKLNDKMKKNEDIVDHDIFDHFCLSATNADAQWHGKSVAIKCPMHSGTERV